MLRWWGRGGGGGGAACGAMGLCTNVMCGAWLHRVARQTRWPLEAPSFPPKEGSGCYKVLRLAGCARQGNEGGYSMGTPHAYGWRR